MITPRSLHALSASDRRLLAESAWLLALVRVGLLVVQFPTLRAWLRRRRMLDHQPVWRLAWAVGAIARRWPGATCLAEALVMESMLLGHGHPASLKIGVRPGASRPDATRVAAHAWVECRGEVVMGSVAELDDYGVLS